MQRHHVNYYKGEQLYETNRRETSLTHPRKFNEWIICSFHTVFSCLFFLFSILVVHQDDQVDILGHSGCTLGGVFFYDNEPTVAIV